MFGIIYKARNRVNGKLYVGQTTGTLAHRIGCHFRDAFKYQKGRAFSNAIQKYGAQSFEFEIIDQAESREVLDRIARLRVWAKWRRESKNLGITIPQLWALNKAAVQ